MTESSALAARAAALDLLAAALDGRRGLDTALADPGFLRLGVQDRGFARAVVMAALRHLGPIDAALQARLKRATPERVRNILRLGLAQAYYLDTPMFAAVDTAVALAPKGLRGLVNAVLRGQIRDGPPDDEPERLAPPWLFARWRATFGPEAARAVAAMIAREPATDLTCRGPADARLVAELEAEALPGGLRTRRRGEVSAWPGYAEGAWWVQDAAAAIPARLLKIIAGESAVDLCAAPGGKTFQLAVAGAVVTALDRAAPRLARLNDGLERLRLEAEVICADAAAWSDMRLFDAVLLDAPCSSTGAFRRHPDLLWNVRPRDIAALADVQARLLAAAAVRVRPGGRLVYSVCSLEPEEGEAQVRAFLAGQPEFALEPIATGEAGAPPASLDAQGHLRILPCHMEGGLDGFFIARFRRMGGS
jgi:16S rRNA (cytosine967-C5)-methyltransferase